MQGAPRTSSCVGNRGAAHSTFQSVKASSLPQQQQQPQQAALFKAPTAQQQSRQQKLATVEAPGDKPSTW